MVPDSRSPLPVTERERLRRRLLDCGFDRVGFAGADRAPDAGRLRRWVERGFAADMQYMKRNLDRREDPRGLLPGARTVIVLAVHHPGPEAEALPEGPTGRACIAAYARGRDYHRILERRLRTACSVLEAEFPARYRWYVDTGPVLERSWAARAGVGWIGKNTCAIDPRAGSYFFLGVIVTTLGVPADSPATDHCGTCTRCIDACPTDAIVDAFQLDSRRCISYLTIENRGLIPQEHAAHFGNLVFGCDICQEVCPYNRRATRPADPELAPREANLAPRLADLAGLTEARFRERFQASPVLRARYRGFLRNVLVALGNDPDREAEDALRALEGRPEVQQDPTLRETLALAWRLRARRKHSG